MTDLETKKQRRKETIDQTLAAALGFACAIGALYIPAAEKYPTLQSLLFAGWFTSNLYCFSHSYSSNKEITKKLYGANDHTDNYPSDKEK